MIDRRVDISQSGKVWMLLAGLGVGLYILWQLSNSIAAGSSRAALLIASAFVAFFVAGRIAGDWRSGVYFFFVWLLFEDLIRKYMGNNMYVYFVKDVLVLMIYIALLAERSKRNTPLFRVPFKYALGTFVVFGFVQFFNPHSPSILLWRAGAKTLFLLYSIDVRGLCDAAQGRRPAPIPRREYGPGGSDFPRRNSPNNYWPRFPQS